MDGAGNGNRLRDFAFLPVFIALAAIFCLGLLLSPSSLISGDTYFQIFPLMDFYSQSIKALEFPFWNPYEFAGLPFPGQMQTGALYPLNMLLYFLLSPLSALNWGVILHIGLGGWFMFVYLRGLGLGRAASFAGGCAYAFIGQFPMSRANIAHMNSAAWIPLALHFARSIAAAPGVGALCGLSASVALQMLAGGTQMCVYTYMAVGIYCAMLIAEKRGAGLKPSALIILGLVAGFACSAGHIAWSAELSGLSVRDAFRESFGAMFIDEFAVSPKGAPALIFPLAYTGGAFRWWETIQAHGYLPVTGLSVLAIGFTALLSSAVKRLDAKFWIIVSLAATALIIMEATPGAAVIYHTPALGSFRVHGRSLILVSFGLAVFTAFSAESVIKSGMPFRRLAVFPVIFLFAAIVAALALRMFAPPETSIAFGFASPRVLGSLIIFSLAAFGLWLAARLKGNWALVAILFVLALEAVFFAPSASRGKISAAEAENICAGKGYERLATQGEESPVRIANIKKEKFGDGYNIPCGIGRLNAYDQLMPLDFATLLDLEQLGYSRYWDYLIMNNTLLSMMSVRYIYAPAGEEGFLESVKAVESPPAPGVSLKDLNVYNLSPEGNAFRNIINRSRQFEPGVYLLSFTAMPHGDEPAFLRSELFTEQTRNDRFKYSPMNVFPGRLGSAPEAFQRIFVWTGESAPATMTLISMNYKPVEVSGLALTKLEGYGPLPLNENIKPGGPVYIKKFEADGMSVYENLNALPAAFSIKNIIPVKDIREIRKILELNKANPSESAFVFESESEGLAEKIYSKGDVSVKEYGLNRVVINASFKADGFAVLSEQYYPGWRAYMDGKEVRIHRVNGIMRGVEVPAGESEILFIYRPWGLIGITIAGLALLAAVSAIAVREAIRKT